MSAPENSGGVPEEAVQLVWKALPSDAGLTLDEVEAAIGAVLPAILKARDSEWERRLGEVEGQRERANEALDEAEHRAAAWRRSTEKAEAEQKRLEESVIYWRNAAAPLPPQQDSEVAGEDPALRRERAVDELLELAKLADTEQMREDLERLASHFSFPPKVDPEIPRCGGTKLDPRHPSLAEDCPGCPDCLKEEESWVCDSCGRWAPAETEGWEQTGPDDAGVTVERCPDCRLTPDCHSTPELLGEGQRIAYWLRFLGRRLPGLPADDRALLGEAADLLASTQPESPGSSETDRQRADRLEVECAELEDANRSLAKMRDKALEGNLAVADQPAPGNSDGVEEGPACARCGGDGIEDVEGGTAPCGDCYGTGRAHVRCPSCLGEGHVEAGPPGATYSVPCARCHSRGYVPTVAASTQPPSPQAEPQGDAVEVLLPYVEPDGYGEGTDQMRRENAAAALAKLEPLLRSSYALELRERLVDAVAARMWWLTQGEHKGGNEITPWPEVPRDVANSWRREAARVIGPVLNTPPPSEQPFRDLKAARVTPAPSESEDGK